MVLDRDFHKVDPLEQLKFMWELEADLNLKREKASMFIMSIVSGAAFLVGVLILVSYLQRWLFSPSQSVDPIGVIMGGVFIILGSRFGYLSVYRLKNPVSSPESVTTFDWWGELEGDKSELVEAVVSPTVKSALENDSLDLEHKSILRNLVVGYEIDRNKPDLSYQRKVLGCDIFRAGEKHGLTDHEVRLHPRSKWSLGS